MSHPPPMYIYITLPSGYFKKEITGQHWSGPKGQIDYWKKEFKKKNVSSSSEYSINHQDPKSRFSEEEQDSINHQDPKVDGTTRIFHQQQKTQRGDWWWRRRIFHHYQKTQRGDWWWRRRIFHHHHHLHHHQRWSRLQRSVPPHYQFGLKFLKIHEAASPPPPPPSDLSAGCLVG